MEDASIFQKFRSQNVQTFGFVYHDTNGLNRGPVWKIQSFLLREICAVILWQDSYGKGNSRKFYQNTLGKKFEIGNVDSLTEKTINLVCACGWNQNWVEKKQNIDPTWKVLVKSVDLGEPTSFLDHVYLGCTQRECQTSEDVVNNYRSMFESRISAGAIEKLPCSGKLDPNISSWSFEMEGHAKKCVERYCELANKTTLQLYKVTVTPLQLRMGVRFFFFFRFFLHFFSFPCFQCFFHFFHYFVFYSFSFRFFLSFFILSRPLLTLKHRCFPSKILIFRHDSERTDRDKVLWSWEKVLNWECLLVNRARGLFLSVYVDDVKLAGKTENIIPTWKFLMKNVDLEEPTSFLEPVFWDALKESVKSVMKLRQTTKIFSNPGFLLEPRTNYLWEIQGNLMQKHYLLVPVTWKVMQSNVWKYFANLRIKTTRQLYKVATPCIDDHQFKEEEMGSVRGLWKVCSQIVLKCLY